MTMKSGFHNSINGDRKYNAEDMCRPYKDILSNGVFPNPSDQLQVFASSGMTVSVSSGGGLFGKGWAYNDAPVLLTLNSSEATLTRIDAIVVRRDDSESVRDTILTIKKGTPSTNPVAPTMVHDDYVDEYCLATIRIAPGTTVITNSMITDTRPNTKVCGFVTGLIDQVDTSTLFNQWQSAYEEQYEKFMDEFEVWWSGVQSVLANNTSASAEVVRLREEKADKIRSQVTLDFYSWALGTDGVYSQTVNVDGIRHNSVIIVGPHEEYVEDYAKAGVICADQDDGVLTFKATVRPIGTLVANVLNMGV